MKRFLSKTLLLLLPLVALILYYAILDPFRVIYSYENHYQDTKVSLNRDYVSLNNYLNICNESRPNAFIFGNSRTIVYRASSWQHYADDSLRVYHFDASGGDLFGMSQAITWLDKRGDKIEHALVMFDPDSFNVTPQKAAPLYNRPYQINPKTNYIEEQWAFFKSFVNPKFFLAYNDWLIFRKIRSYMKDLFNTRPFAYNRSTNQIEYTEVDSIIAIDPAIYYTNERMKVFYDRDTTIISYEQPLIGPEQLERLKTIKSVFNSHHTQYQIVIHPLYNLLKLDKQDIAILVDIFGADSVWDFSGYNNLTKDYTNYYESSHYRTNVADSVFKVVYHNK